MLVQISKNLKYIQFIFLKNQQRNYKISFLKKNSSINQKYFDLQMFIQKIQKNEIPLVLNDLHSHLLKIENQKLDNSQQILQLLLDLHSINQIEYFSQIINNLIKQLKNPSQIVFQFFNKFLEIVFLVKGVHKQLFIEFLHLNLIQGLQENIITISQLQQVVQSILKQQFTFESKQNIQLINLLNLKILNTSSLNDDKKVLSSPQFYLHLIQLNIKFKIYNYDFFQQVEKKLLNIIEKDSLKTFFIAFQYLNQQGSGGQVYNKIINTDQSQLKIVLESYSSKNLVWILFNLLTFHIQKVWQEQSFENNQMSKEIFLMVQQQIYTLIKKDEFIFQIILKIIEDRKLEEMSLQDKQHLFRVFQITQNCLSLTQKQSGQFSKLCKMLKSTRFQKQQNEFTTDLLQVLDSREISYNKEYFIKYRTCDLYLPEYNIILELDGPYHYYDNSSKLLLSNIVRNYFILDLGYKLFEVNFSKWEYIRNSKTIEHHFNHSIQKLQTSIYIF